MSVPDLNPDLLSAFDAFSDGQKEPLLKLRELIFSAAEAHAEIGTLTESLKWGQPSYTPAKPRIGSSVRLGVPEPDSVALYFICNTSLVEHFREIYPQILNFEGNRAIILPAKGEWPIAELKHCIAMALTYHLKAAPARHTLSPR